MGNKITHKPHVNVGTISTLTTVATLTAAITKAALQGGAELVIAPRLTTLQKKKSVVLQSTHLTSSMRQKLVTMPTLTAQVTRTMLKT